MKKLSKSSIIFILFCIILGVINLFFFKEAFKLSSTQDNYLFYILIVGLSFIELIMCFLIYKKNKKDCPLEKIFLIMAIPLGFLYLIFIPVGQVPDEHNHYARSYSISKGYLVSLNTKNGDGYAPLPTQVSSMLISNKEDSYKKTFNNIKQHYDKNETNLVFTNTSLYNFIVYIPQVIGIIIGRIFHLPILLIAYLARLFNLAVYISLMYFSIKNLPFFKNYLLFFALLPISLQEASSISSDALTICSSFFLVSYILHLKYSYKGKITNKQYALLFITSIISSMCKIVYLPLVLLIFILPTEKFNSKREKCIKLILLFITCILINGAWTLYASRYLVETNIGVSSKEQLIYALTHPFNYIIIILRTIKTEGINFVYQLYGRSLSLLDVDVKKFYSFISIIISICLLISESFTKKIVSRIDKILSLMITIMIIGLIFTSLYIQWTPLKKGVVWGVQGRYFIPIMMLIPILFSRTNENKIKIIIDTKKIDNKYLLSYIVFQGLSALSFIICACI